MGKAVGRLLAEKGANVIIVARNVAKLEEALKYISVCPRYSCVGKKWLKSGKGARFKTLIAALSLHQCRLDRFYRSGAHSFRNDGMERKPTPRRNLVLRRLLSPRTLYGRAD